MTTRVTIDSTVIHTLSKPREDGHADAVWLVGAAERGDVALTIAAQGSWVDLRPGMVADHLRTLIDQGAVRVAPQVSRLSSDTFPSDDLFPGNTVPGFADAWASEVARLWPANSKKAPGPKDCWHVESHVLGGGDVFVTDDVRLRTLCASLAPLGFVIEAVALADFVAAAKAGAYAD